MNIKRPFVTSTDFEESYVRDKTATSASYLEDFVNFLVHTVTPYIKPVGRRTVL